MRIFHGLFFEHGGQRRACVFGVNVDIPGDHRLLGQERAAEIELAADMSVQAILEMLGHDFSEDQLLGEILRGYADARFVAAGAAREHTRAGDEEVASRALHAAADALGELLHIVELFQSGQGENEGFVFLQFLFERFRETSQFARIFQVFFVVLFENFVASASFRSADGYLRGSAHPNPTGDGS